MAPEPELLDVVAVSDDHLTGAGLERQQQRAVGLDDRGQRRRDLSESVGWGGDDRVPGDGAAEGSAAQVEGAQVADGELEGRVGGAGGVDHAAGVVEAERLATEGGDPGRDASGAAAGVEHDPSGHGVAGDDVEQRDLEWRLDARRHLSAHRLDVVPGAAVVDPLRARDEAIVASIDRLAVHPTTLPHRDDAPLRVRSPVPAFFGRFRSHGVHCCQRTTGPRSLLPKNQAPRSSR